MAQLEQQVSDEKMVRRHAGDELTLQRRNSREAGKGFEEREAELRAREEEAREREDAANAGAGDAKSELAKAQKQL